MAATVTSTALQDQEKSLYYTVHLTNLYNDAAETNVVKIDKSALVGPDGTEPTTIRIMSVRWNIQGYTYVKLSWDHDTDITAMLLTGSGYEDFSPFGGKPDAGTGGTGDLLLTTIGGIATSTYDISITVRMVD